MYKILIRPLEVKDANISWKWRNDPEVWAQTGNRPDKPITLDIEIEWIKKVINDKTTKRFAITVDDQYVGNVQFTDITNSDAQFHIFIGEKSFWGKGVGNQATYQILNYGKEILKLTEVYLFVKKSNFSAIKVYEKNLFITTEQFVEEIKMTCKIIDLVEPMVSIFCMVYNHENYVCDTIEGFLMQKNNFNATIVLGEDCSTDGSRRVINSYVEKFPGKFRLIYQNVNIGANKNQEIILRNCKGKYIALCEGDDYWTDPLKLQKQVDFLERNQEYSITFTDYEILNENTKKIVSAELVPKFKSKSVFLLRDIIITNFIPTLTVLYRNNGVRFPNNGDKLFPGDWPLHILNASKGKIKFLPFTSAVYRKHDNGVCSSSNSIDNYKRYLVTLRIVKKWFKNDLAIQCYFVLAQARIYAGIIKNYFK